MAFAARPEPNAHFYVSLLDDMGFAVDVYPRTMPQLVLHGRPVPTIFDFLGHKENDMTAALGWGITHNAALMRLFLARVAPELDVAEPIVVEL